MSCGVLMPLWTATSLGWVGLLLACSTQIVGNPRTLFSISQSRESSVTSISRTAIPDCRNSAATLDKLVQCGHPCIFKKANSRFCVAQPEDASRVCCDSCMLSSFASLCRSRAFRRDIHINVNEAAQIRATTPTDTASKMRSAFHQAADVHAKLIVHANFKEFEQSCIFFSEHNPRCEIC